MGAPIIAAIWNHDLPIDEIILVYFPYCGIGYMCEFNLETI